MYAAYTSCSLSLWRRRFDEISQVDLILALGCKAEGMGAAVQSLYLLSVCLSVSLAASLSVCLSVCLCMSFTTYLLDVSIYPSTLSTVNTLSVTRV